jgi:AraC-like DNA-binding protein
LAVVAERGVPAATLVADLPVDVSALEDPRARVPISLCEGILSRAIELTGDCGLAQRLGERMPISSHGYLGFAAMTATTIKEAVELAVRFASTRVPAIGLALYTDGPTTSLVLEERRNLPPLLRRFIVIALFSELATIFTSLTGKGLDSDVYVAFPDPGGIISPPGVRVHFDAPAHRVVFATGMLALPIVSADRVACRLAREQCERDLSRLVDNSGIAARVRELLAREDELASLEDIADSLRVSPRTLKRKLADVGVTFSEIRDEHRRQQALLLLDNRDLSVGDVAVRMGYTELTNFTRAFRKWTGLTPQAYRRRGLSG